MAQVKSETAFYALHVPLADGAVRCRLVNPEGVHVSSRVIVLMCDYIKIHISS